ncbi:four helix bundle protein [Chlamydiota bacterium]
MYKIYSYKDLKVWQKAMELVVEIYNLTELFRKKEIYGLTAHLRKTSISIPSNIAEGRCRGSKKEYLQFLRIAYGSSAELETQIEIAKRLKMTGSLNYTIVDSLLLEVLKMLRMMIKKMSLN